LRVIDRIFEYLKHYNLTPYTFERACGIANGYLKKQTKGKGTIGSEILEKITEKYKDISLTWLVTGKGSMLIDMNYKTGAEPGNWSEDEAAYTSADHMIKLLREKISILENALNDKEKIITMLEKQEANK
jgi:hypothetical protein